MSQPPRPGRRPDRPFFSSGPCPKPPTWSPAALAGAWVSRSHRAAGGRARLQEVLARSRELLQLPAEHVLAITPGSGTGAFEILMWNLLGARGVDVLSWDSFGNDWLKDVSGQLQIADQRHFVAGDGELPELPRDNGRDRVFLWNGTTSGIALSDADWIGSRREGLTLCDASSAILAYHLPWQRLDATSYSWQKVLGGEAGFGMVAMSPAALRRMSAHRPAWPIPKLFALTSSEDGTQGFRDQLAVGDVINTPSMLAVEDCLFALQWLHELGGLDAAVARSQASLAVIAEWVAATEWVDFVARAPATRSRTSVCLRITDPAFLAMPVSEQRQLLRRLVDLLEAEQVAFDIAGYRRAPPGLRIWTGATVATEDVAAMLPWLDWAWRVVGMG